MDEMQATYKCVSRSPLGIAVYLSLISTSERSSYGMGFDLQAEEVLTT